MIRAGSARHVLVIGAEKLSDWVDPLDRSTCIIFADGAGRRWSVPRATTADVDVLVPHQANLRIVEAIARRMQAAGAREDIVVADDIVHSGNTSSASIPLALDHMRAEGRVRSGDHVVVTGAQGGHGSPGRCRWRGRGFGMRAGASRRCRAPDAELGGPRSGVQFDVVTGSAREVGLRAAVNDSFGFSGHNVALGLCCEWAWRSVGWPTRSL
jgi:hypothetical protein